MATRVHLADLDFPLSPLNGQPHGKNVLIFGAGHGKDEAQMILSSPQWEVWALNLVPPIDADGQLRADRWFDLHQRRAQSPDDLRWIAKCPVPIYLTPDMMDASPNARTFPLEGLERQFGKHYWACTFAYQIALAISEGYTRIGLYGVELAFGSGRERTVEWANVSYWIGMAQMAGVRILKPSVTMLAEHPFRYGFEYTEELEAVKTYTDAYDKHRDGCIGE